MNKCSDSCEPACDFCIWAIKEDYDVDGVKFSNVVGCKKHTIEDIDGGFFCNDFYCFNFRDKVLEMREKTGIGMMDCEKALIESDGDIDKAIKSIREKGLNFTFVDKWNNKGEHKTKGK